MIDGLLRFINRPQQLVFKTWAKFPVGSFERRLAWDIFPRPHYAYCTYHAARLAERLGIERISVIEFGVAGGNGLVELERMAEAVEQEFKTKIDVYGFDTGLGLPPPLDYRDLPYIWQEGHFKMDIEALKARLSRANLVFGDVKDTVPTFCEKHKPAPIGAVFMDLDYYSATIDGLEIFETPSEYALPRVFCYFDDVGSAEGGGIMCDKVGQLLAIDEYNDRNDRRHLARIGGFEHTRNRKASWNDKIFVHHAFDHPHYDTYIHRSANRQLQLQA
ncbi:MAG: hypothetical protein KDA28_08875 [Phycisphaerales bacterium]|nr:hypothetical protein [Phycisphaerales bacterium]